MAKNKQDIESLLVLCKKGNRLAQLEVYNRYQQAMYNTSIRILKNAGDAEDIMQESFITAFDKLDTFKGTATFGAWLKRIVINNSLTYLKKTQRLEILPETNLKDQTEEGLGITEEDYTKTKAAKIMACMAKLHTSYREVLTLHLIEGYDHEELCEIMNISYANCRTLISRAKDSLRKNLVS